MHRETTYTLARARTILAAEKRQINEARFTQMVGMYTSYFECAIKADPQKYVQLNRILTEKGMAPGDYTAKLVAGFLTGESDKSGVVFKEVRKKLGLKDTYKAIKEWLTEPAK